jgi:V/A-type H+-transporting ATPase subunit F
MKRIVFITPPDAEYGFKLTGVSHVTCEEGDVESTLQEMIHEYETGLIIIDERLLNAFPEDRLRQIEQAFHGVILDLPAPERPEAEIEDYAAKLIRRAIGYHVKLKL